MDYPRALAYLEDLETRGFKLTLHNIQEIVDHFPYDLSRIKFIQVAGTNGKGSTCHFITSILQAAGFKVGLFTSPHLQDIRERISIDKTWISETDFAESVTRVMEVAEDLASRKIIDNLPSFFEHLFLAALYYFSQRPVQVAVLEVGLGGRLDATSTLTPDLAVITTISHDHTRLLGKRIRDIAAEKAGIIKPRVPVVSGCPLHSSAHRVIREAAQEKKSPFFNVFDAHNRLDTEDLDAAYGCTYTTQAGQYDFNVFLNGRHQVINACTAVKAIEVLNNGNGFFRVSAQAIRQGIEDNFVPGRIEVFPLTPPVILDGSHNVQSVQALVRFLEEKKKKDLTLVFGVLKDKQYRKMFSLLLPYARNIVLTEPPFARRALEAEKLVGLCSHKNVMVIKNPALALQAAGQFKEEILVSGSLYLAGEIRNIIHHGGQDGCR